MELLRFSILKLNIHWHLNLLFALAAYIFIYAKRM